MQAVGQQTGHESDAGFGRMLGDSDVKSRVYPPVGIRQVDVSFADGCFQGQGNFLLGVKYGRLMEWRSLFCTIFVGFYSEHLFITDTLLKLFC